MKRKHISYKTKLAAALRELLRIPYGHAVLLSEDQILSLVQWHHIRYHADSQIDEHWNLEPLTIKVHREMTALVDIPQIAKTKRISAAHEEFRRKLLTPRDERPIMKSRWGSRPFPKRRKP